MGNTIQRIPTIKGIDISAVQGLVDFQAVKAAGIDFCIRRCGVGNNGIDAYYQRNMTAGTAAGLKMATYNFLFPLPNTPSEPLRDPTAQAQYHAKAVGGLTKVIFADFEWPVQADWAKWGCSAPQIAQWLATYLQAYEDYTGIRPIVYTYPDYARSINLPAAIGRKYRLWIASYDTTTPLIPAPWTNYILWRNGGGTGRLPPSGIPVDTDLAFDLSLWDEPTVEAPVAVQPIPAPVVPIATPVPAPVPPTNIVPVAPVPIAKPNLFALIGQLISGLVNKYLR